MKRLLEEYGLIIGLCIVFPLVLLVITLFS